VAASRRSPNKSGKPDLDWIPLGPPSVVPGHKKERIGSWMARVADGSIYVRFKAVEGDEWHAVREKGGESETIGTGDYGDVYHYCKNHWHWDEVSPKQR
jgi:hypothetical protein